MNTNQTESQDFAKLVDLQNQHTRTFNDLERVEALINKESNRATEKRIVSYTILQERLSTLDGQIKALFEKHPEWRGDKKSVSTPYGSVEQHSSTSLEIPNKAMTVALIRARGAEDKTFIADDFIHKEESPNLEALEKLNDDELAKLGVNRRKKESITVKPAKVNVAKAVKAAAKQQPERKAA